MASLNNLVWGRARHGLKVSCNTRSISNLRNRNLPLDVHPEVEAALAEKRPVVALETALVTHGVPFPENAKLAKSLEHIVRSTGSIPATIGIINGRVKIGLEPSEVDLLADSTANPAAKVSRRDISAAIVSKSHGGTTCAATLVFAALAGIKVFATGGLGGVHRGGENSMDISADLGELTRCPVGLVSAGVKSILDIGRTLEYLETLGVPVISYGKTTDFPAFFSSRSGFQSPWNFDNPEAIAKLLYTQWQLGLQNGAIIACPIPEPYEVSGASIQQAVDQAIAESEANGISKQGKAVTPWLLARVSELTQGKSLVNNIALLENTAKIGGQVAVEYANLAQNSEASPSSGSTFSDFGSHSPSLSKSPDPPTPKGANSIRLLIVGCAAIDITAQAASGSDATLTSHSTTPGHVSLTLGGVARNIAEAAHRLVPSRTKLISAVGDDSLGRLLGFELRKTGMIIDGLVQTEGMTAVCNMYLDRTGQLIGGVADMGIIASLDVKRVIAHIGECQPSIVALDGNLTPNLIRSVVNFCEDRCIEVFFEPTSVAKSTVIFSALPILTDEGVQMSRPQISITPNLLELNHLYHSVRVIHPSQLFEDWEQDCTASLRGRFGRRLSQYASEQPAFANISKTGEISRALSLLRYFHRIVIKCGELGAVVALRVKDADGWMKASGGLPANAALTQVRSGETVIVQHFPALPTSKLVNVTGAGDSFVGALLGAMVEQQNLFHEPSLLHHAIQLAQQAAVLTLGSPLAVSPNISHLRGHIL